MTSADVIARATAKKKVEDKVAAKALAEGKGVKAGDEVATKLVAKLTGVCVEQANSDGGVPQRLADSFAEYSQSALVMLIECESFKCTDEVLTTRMKTAVIATGAPPRVEDINMTALFNFLVFCSVNGRASIDAAWPKGGTYTGTVRDDCRVNTITWNAACILFTERLQIAKVPFPAGSRAELCEKWFPGSDDNPKVKPAS